MLDIGFSRSSFPPSLLSSCRPPLHHCSTFFYIFLLLSFASCFSCLFIPPCPDYILPELENPPGSQPEDSGCRNIWSGAPPCIFSSLSGCLSSTVSSSTLPGLSSSSSLDTMVWRHLCDEVSSYMVDQSWMFSVHWSCSSGC